MKNRVIKVVAFILIFAILFGVIQGVLHYRWTSADELYTRNISLKMAPENSIDVLVLGTSEVYAGIFPEELFHEAGITGMNLATQNKSALTSYYQLKYVLKYQKPKVVVCDFVAMYEDYYQPSVSETIYRKVVDTMPDLDIKYELIADMKKSDPEMSALSYIFPLLRYHTIWEDLKAENFEKDHVYNPEYKEYSRGCMLSDGKYSPDQNIGEFILPEYWDRECYPDEQTDFARYYYKKMIDMCRENGAEVVCLLTPKISDGHLQQYIVPQFHEFFDPLGVEIIDYSSYEEVTRLGLNLKEDYFDSAHLNYKGAVKLSRDFADKLKSGYDLRDRRLDLYDASGNLIMDASMAANPYDYNIALDWEQGWQQFSIDYGYLDTGIKRKTDVLAEDGAREITIYTDEEYPCVSVVKSLEGQPGEIIVDRAPLKEYTIRVLPYESGVIGYCIYKDVNSDEALDAMTFVY